MNDVGQTKKCASKYLREWEKFEAWRQANDGDAKSHPLEDTLLNYSDYFKINRHYAESTIWSLIVTISSRLLLFCA